MKSLRIISILILLLFQLDNLMAQNQIYKIKDLNFENALIELGLDNRADGILLKSHKIDSTLILDVSNKGILSLEGLEVFENLRVLKCNNNKLKILDLTKNKEVFKLFCDTNELTGILFGKGGNGFDVYMEKISCGHNKLSVLDLTQLDKNGLRQLNCSNNLITTLNLSMFGSLRALDCSNNNLTNLNLEGTTLLSKLNCKNNQLKTLDLSSVNSLEFLDCSFNLLSTLKASINKGEIYCNNNQLTELIIPWFQIVYVVDCSKNKISVINFPTQFISELNCSNNDISKIDLKDAEFLRELNVNFNKIKSLNLSGNVGLISLEFMGNPISAISLVKNSELEFVNCSLTNLQKLNVSKNKKLKTLIMFDVEIEVEKGENQVLSIFSGSLSDFEGED